MQMLSLATQRAIRGTPRAQTAARATAKRTSLVPQLRALAEQLNAAIHEGQLRRARRLAHQYTLPPIAWGYIASLLHKRAVPAEVIEGVLS